MTLVIHFTFYILHSIADCKLYIIHSDEVCSLSVISEIYVVKHF